jgi:hypothetical protein
MPISLDSLLFWCGLALLSIGLFIFLTGRRASDESKKESNRFEAFGIKIDVNNPSLILIMLGVVMMLSPDSNYWPDYHIHLHNCETSRSRHEVYKHLNPSNRDRFPFEEAINEKTMKFLSDSRWIAGS